MQHSTTSERGRDTLVLLLLVIVVHIQRLVANPKKYNTNILILYFTVLYSTLQGGDGVLNRKKKKDRYKPVAPVVQLVTSKPSVVGT